MAIQSSFNGPAGTLYVYYTDAQEKQKIDHFTLKKGEVVTELALSKVWVNGCPAIYLKGFKSTPLPGEIQFTLNNDLCDITLPPFKSIGITIKVEEGKELELQVPEKLKVTGLKKIIAKKLDIDDPINLKHDGYALDGSITLEDSGFGSGTEFTLKLSNPKEEESLEEEKLTDGALELGGGFASLNFVKPEKDKIIQPDKKAPDWRAVCKGLNLKAECTNKICKAFQQIVYIQKGMGTFNMAEECCEATCPECKTAPAKDVSNCGFVACTYSIIGTMENGTKFSQENKKAPKDAFLTFEEIVNGEIKLTKWRYLKITTEPLEEKKQSIEICVCS